ncbi:amino acid permease/ SLC12A domain-containing protein [Aspergillus karnatakaensis]|uniref:putative amino acid permease n=1 Tax=Aspergillus karnatakaensis TaxID=1810916 RepID=UPI003CCD6D44
MSPSESSSSPPSAELLTPSNPESTRSQPSYELNPDAKLKPYEVTLITIGGAINTGLMIAFGNALSRSGVSLQSKHGVRSDPTQQPASTLISYTFVGFIVFLVLSALGEVASFSPEPTTLHTQANRFCGPSLGFTLGWIYWLKYMMVIINQMTAGVVVISYWTTVRVGDKAAYITVFLAVIIGMNYWSGRFLGRYEVTLSSFKVLMVIGLMILSLVLALGGGPDHEKKGFRYWRWPGAFANDEDKTSLGIFRAIFRTFPSTTLSYLGTELIGMAVLHTQDSRKAAARAIHQTFYRILAFNLVIVTLLGMAIPYDEDILALPIYTSKRSASAFVVAVQMAHVRVLPDILNACILVFVVSAASRALCMATRIIRELSLEHNAPVFLHQTDKRGVPVYALGASCAPALMGFLNLLSISGRLWSYLVNLVTMFSILTWVSILVMHISFVRFCKAKQVPAQEVPFKAPFGIAGSWIALVLCISIPIMRAIELCDRNFYSHGLDIGTFVTSFLGIPLYLALVLGYKFVSKQKKLRAITKAESLPTGHRRPSRRETETDGAGPGTATKEKTPWRVRTMPIWLI